MISRRSLLKGLGCLIGLFVLAPIIQAMPSSPAPVTKIPEVLTPVESASLDSWPGFTADGAFIEVTREMFQDELYGVVDEWTDQMDEHEPGLRP